MKLYKELILTKNNWDSGYYSTCSVMLFGSRSLYPETYTHRHNISDLTNKEKPRGNINNEKWVNELCGAT